MIDADSVSHDENTRRSAAPRCVSSRITVLPDLRPHVAPHMEPRTDNIRKVFRTKVVVSSRVSVPLEPLHEAIIHVGRLRAWIDKNRILTDELIESGKKKEEDAYSRIVGLCGMSSDISTTMYMLGYVHEMMRRFEDRKPIPSIFRYTELFDRDGLMAKKWRKLVAPSLINVTVIQILALATTIRTSLVAPLDFSPRNMLTAAAYDRHTIFSRIFDVATLAGDINNVCLLTGRHRLATTMVDPISHYPLNPLED